MKFQDLPIGTIDLETGEVHIINNIDFGCKSSGDCCRKNEIPVTEKEVERIMDKGWELDQFLESLMPVVLPGKTEGTRIKAYILKKKPFTRDCVFLDEENRCKIHEFKPFACRMYPFSYNVAGKNKIEVRVHAQNVCANVKLGGTDNRSRNILNDIYMLLKEKFLS